MRARGRLTVRRRATRGPRTGRIEPRTHPSEAPRDSPARSETFERFRALDEYRVNREWNRYEGTAQRDLLRTLRERFLRRHALTEGRAVDLGCGPGRFLPVLVTGSARAVGLDVSVETLRQAGERRAHDAIVERVRGDARRPPFIDRSFSLVVALGNLIGFASADGAGLLEVAARLVTDGGVLVVEVAPGAGERSAYFGRLPPSALGRLLRAPKSAVLPRVRREGFREETARKRKAGEFGRWPVEETVAVLEKCGLHVEDELSVAPALGSSPERVTAVRGDPKAWEHLVEIEEELGRDRARSPVAAAVLVAARRDNPTQGTK